MAKARFSLRKGILSSVIDSDNNTLKRNKASLNDGWGYLVDEVLSNTFEDNRCFRNGLGGSDPPGIC